MTDMNSPLRTPRKSTAEPTAASKEAHEQGLDKTLADTFPASDPLSTIPDPASPEPVEDGEQAA